MNRVIMTGRLTKNPELRQTQSGVDFCSFSIAVKREHSYEDKADFFNCSAWRTTAQNVSKYLKKGSLVGIVGRLENNDYEGNDGVKRQSTKINVEQVDFLESATASDNVQTATRERPKLKEFKDAPDFPTEQQSMDDLPF